MQRPRCSAKWPYKCLLMVAPGRSRSTVMVVVFTDDSIVFVGVMRARAVARSREIDIPGDPHARPFVARFDDNGTVRALHDAALGERLAVDCHGGDAEPRRPQGGLRPVGSGGRR